MIEPGPGRVHIIVLDERDRILHRVSPDYAQSALDRGEVTLTEHTGVVRIVPGGWHPQPNGNKRRRM